MALYHDDSSREFVAMVAHTVGWISDIRRSQTVTFAIERRGGTDIATNCSQIYIVDKCILHWK